MIINNYQILDVAYCNAASSMGYSLYIYLKDKMLRGKWISAVKWQKVTGMDFHQLLSCAQRTSWWIGL